MIVGDGHRAHESIADNSIFLSAGRQAKSTIRQIIPKAKTWIDELAKCSTLIRTSHTGVKNR